MTIKNILERYIIYGIDSEEWNPGDKVPSEHFLATKFNCSRTTARNALHSLVGRGMLKSKKCKGYFVCDNFSIVKNSVPHKFTQVYMNNISPSFFRSFNYDCSNLTKRYLVKNVDREHKCKSLEIFLLNKEIYGNIYPTKNWPIINRKIMKKIKLVKIIKTIIFSYDSMFPKIVKKLGDGDRFPKLIKCYVAENDKIIYISVKAIRKEDFVIKTTINI